MTTRNHIARVRQAVLGVAFELLYTRLGFLHEATGQFVCGAAWNGRRRHVLPDMTATTVLDLGCGEGRFLASLSTTGSFALGIEPSRQMTARAARRGALVVRAAAQATPIMGGSIDHVVATYPGPWIVDQATWDEIARITRPGASIAILLGGDYERGRWAFVRRRLLRLAYGGTSSTATMPRLGHPSISGDYREVNDRWGTAILWHGVRRDRLESPASDDAG
jgi:SAM-dependent methyltransferase